MPRGVFLIVSSSLCAIFWATGTVQAQEADCSKIETKVERIRCIMEAEKPNLATSYTAPEVNWSLSQHKSEMTDEIGVYGRTKAQDTISCGQYLTRATPELLISCHENETTLVLITGCFMSDAGGFGQVRLRVDGREAIDRSFTESSDNSALGVWGARAARPVLEYLGGSTSLLIEFAPYREATQTARFKTDGIDAVVRSVRDQCGW
jgi:hypothetical protein